MAIPTQFRGRLRIPIIAAPMFLVLGPDLVVEACRAGIVGSFPALNQRSSEGYEAWLQEITARLEENPGAPFGVNLVVHKSNPRWRADLELTVKYCVPLVISTLTPETEVVDAVHSYGGVVLHSVINMHHAEKALNAGVDGLIGVCSGAGGHAGTYNPFAFATELRALLGEKTLVLAGGISNGQGLAAAIMCGADMASLGTLFVASDESMAADAYKRTICASSAKDIVYTSKVSGLAASFLRPSLEAVGIDLARIGHAESFDVMDEMGQSKPWKDIWTAGQGVGGIHDVLPVRALCERLGSEYQAAIRRMMAFSAAQPVG